MSVGSMSRGRRGHHPTPFGERALAFCKGRSGGAVDWPETKPETVAATLQQFGQAGLLGLRFLDPDVEGPTPQDVRETLDAIEVLARHSGTFASIYMVNAILGGALIALMGTREQKAKLLPGLREGRLQLAFALTEPEAGSDAASIESVAERCDGGFVLSGNKVYTTGALTADLLLVVARTADAADRRAFTVFLVPGASEGLDIEPLERLASGAHASCWVALDDVRLDEDAVLGGLPAIGTAWPMLRIIGAMERLVVSAMSLGLASAITGRAVDFAKTRKQFGQPIASFQAIQHMLVDMRMGETAMRLFLDNAVSALEDAGWSAAEIPMAKAFCAEQLQTVAALGMRVMGGRSCFRFEEMERYYREAPFSLFAGGTVEVQKMLVARAMGLA